jgi:polar amino acid transport system substrate-binding protein
MRKVVVSAVAALALLAACGQPTRQRSGDRGSPTAVNCDKADLNLVQSGQLTVGTDNPAFPPWFAGGTPEGSPWEINDPATGEGFESAVAYAVAEELGFSEDEVEWVEVPFNQSFKPGPKDFDFDINQISYKAPRDQAVDFSESYYDVNQALVALQANPIADATTLDDLRQFKLGAPIGTTSFDYIEQNVQPEEDPGVYETLNDAISALENGQIDGVVVDLPTGFYVTAVQIDKGVIVGQFPTVGQQEYFGMVFEDGNPLVDCVNQALDTLRADGTLQEIQDKWLSQVVDVPTLE